MTYSTILIDPPWDIQKSGKRKRAKGRHSAPDLPYPTVPTRYLYALPVAELAAPGCHLWLWTTNQTLEDGYNLIRSWGFKALAPIHWVKPTGIGNWFVHRTQTLLFAYYKRCSFKGKRYAPNVIEAAVPTKHSAKPVESYELIEAVSMPARLEVFARAPRAGWDIWGNQAEGAVNINSLDLWGRMVASL